MKKIHMLLPLGIGLLASTVAGHAQNQYATDWGWSGEVSSNWSHTGNWTNWDENANAFVNPDDIGELQGKTIRLGMGRFLPEHQDIEELAVNQLQIGALTNSLVVTGEDFKIADTVFHVTGDNTADTFTAFHNNIAFAPSGNWGGRVYRPLHFYGNVSEYDGPRSFRMSGNGGGGIDGGTHFHGALDISITLWAEANYQFHSLESVVGTLGAHKPEFLTGPISLNLPAGMSEYEYEIPERIGFGSVSVNIYDGVTALFHSPGTATASFGTGNNNTGRIIELCAATNFFTGGINLGTGLLIVRGELAPGAKFGLNQGSLDLDGQNMLDRELISFMDQACNYDGYYRNQNPDRRSRINGDTTQLSSWDWWGSQFGGVGDILYTGDILVEGGGANRFYKVGPGTLTMTGVTLANDAHTGIMGGAMVLDYDAKNGVKIATNGTLWIAGKLDLLGNAEEDTVQTVGTLYLGGRNDNFYHNRVRISPSGREDKSATFRFATLDWDKNTRSAVAVDFAPGDNGFIRTADANLNDANLDALPPRVTFRGESFARVYDDDEEDGYYRVGAVANYHTGFVGATAWSFVDIVGETTNDTPATIAALRFNAPGPATLTLDENLDIAGEIENGNHIGALLVTPNVGAHDVVINGGGILCNENRNGGLTIHQYNTNAALVIHTRILGQSANLVKTGPGELVLKNPSSGFGRFHLFEGIATIDSIANRDEPSTLGQDDWGYPLVIGDATLRYVGEGDATDRPFSLRGFGVIEASGTGPLVFTSGEPVLVPGGYSKNQLLTLSGTGEGVIEGSLKNLLGGRLRKRGTGVWTLNGDSPKIIWGADVMEGVLVLNGTLGRDVTVYGGGTLAGSGSVARNLFVNAGGTLHLDPEAVLKVGKNLVIADGAVLSLPRKLPGDWTPVMKITGNITGEFTPPPHAYVKIEGNKMYAKFRPTGTLFLVR